MSKTPIELFHDWLNTQPPSSERCYGCACQGFQAGFKAGREMSNKEVFDEYIRLREKHQATVVERIKVKVMGIFG
jgi:hypothetical protein